MDIFILLIRKLFVMFLFIFMGAILFKRYKITENGSESLANLLITLILPCVIIRSFLIEPTKLQIMYLLYSILFSFLLLIFSILIAKIFFPKDAIANFASAFSNPGFFGIPLISAVLGDTAVLYAAPFIACLNIFQATYGVSILTNKKTGINIKKLLLLPFTVSFVIGLFLFFLPITLPQTLEDVITYSANLNTPVAMIISGVYLARTDIRSMLKNQKLYRISLVRLIAIPVISLALLSFLSEDFYPLKMCLLIAISCPTGTNVAVYAQLHKKNYCYAAESVVISTLLSAITIPVFVMTAQFIWYI